ncbi:MAG: hypothetical protein PW792_07070 [Acidobacteriaceae bacterium]|nr:hypothetical protein [Acidobacteriaceae bacterium]
MAAEATLRDGKGSPEIGVQELLQQMERELHDLCQPVTSLQCRLELGKMMGGEAALAEAAEGALEDVARIFTAVSRMRAQLMLVMKPE